jgi:hypothetical protein
LLPEAEKKGYSDVVSWLPDGISLKVHDKAKLESNIMSSVFGSSKYRSFQKNLNIWGFESDRRKSIRGVAGRGTLSHSFFVRDYVHLCHRMVHRGRTIAGQSSEANIENPRAANKTTNPAVLSCAAVATSPIPSLLSGVKRRQSVATPATSQLNTTPALPKPDDDNINNSSSDVAVGALREDQRAMPAEQHPSLDMAGVENSQKNSRPPFVDCLVALLLSSG